MGLAKTHTAALCGVGAEVVTVEANIGPGLPGTYIVGLADAAVSEARDRLKTAAQNQHLPWPKSKVVVNLSPASLRKTGTMMDLAMCMAILAAGAPEMDIAHMIFVGEVGLDGAIRGVRGVVPALIAAAEAGVRVAVIPPANAHEAHSVQRAGMTVFCAATISQAAAFAAGEKTLPEATGSTPTQAHIPDMLDVVGQQEAKRAAEIAAAGGHHFMMLGPPGSGKSMIAERFAGILPPLDAAQQLQCQAIASVTGQGGSGRPPFIAPHHSVTASSLLGGGSGTPKPGAVTKAHLGVLFLDEVSEIPAPVLDSLRVPLDRGEVELIRAQGTTRFPAQFQLVLAANPCRCGAADASDCRCSAQQRLRYLHNLSGPLRDRIDMVVQTHPKGSLHDGHAESSEVIAARVAHAAERAKARLQATGCVASKNALVPAGVLRRKLAAIEDAMAMLESYLAVGALSQRAVDRCLRLSWTIADLADAEQPTLHHVAEALEYCGRTRELVA